MHIWLQSKKHELSLDNALPEGNYRVAATVRYSGLENLTAGWVIRIAKNEKLAAYLTKGRLLYVFQQLDRLANKRMVDRVRRCFWHCLKRCRKVTVPTPAFTKTALSL